MLETTKKHNDLPIVLVDGRWQVLASGWLLA
jgi:hypothetical protein